MSWSYENSAHSNKDRVRFLLGDTIELGAMLQDEDIIYALSKNGILDDENLPPDTAPDINDTGCLKVAISLLPALIAQAARQVDYTIGPEKVSASQRLEGLRSLKKALEDELYTGAVACGPIRVDAADSHFKIDQHNYRGW